MLPVPGRLDADRGDRHRLPDVVGQAPDEPDARLHVGGRDPYRQPRPAPPGVPRLPLADRLRDHRPGAVGRERDGCTFHAWEWNAAALEVRARTAPANCSVVYWSTLVGPERAGPLERRPVRVRRPDVQRRHRHVLQLARRATTCSTASSSAGPGAVLNPLGVLELAELRAQQRSRERTRSCRSRPRTRRSARRPTASLGGTGCLYTGPTDDHAARRAGKMNVTSPKTLSTNPGCGPGNEPEPADQRRHLRAERAERAPTRTTRRARARRATVTST